MYPKKFKKIPKTRFYSQKTFNALRGTKDLYGEDADKYFFMIDSARKISSLYGYKEIATPIIEDASLYSRNLGADSDIVNKEMYIFEDKNKEMIALRPENTAGVVRAFISNNMQCSHSNPINLFYHGPMFRYERPQKGRYRQFHQIGIETLGDPNPLCDVFQIALGYQLLSAWNLQDDVKLEINTLGDSVSRKNYSSALKDYFESNKANLSEDSIKRLERGSVLRILDSKHAGDIQTVSGAPPMIDYLSLESKNRWDEVLGGLDNLGLPYSINNRLVRGLDYYTHTCFEFTTTKLGSQSAILAGGRYDDLVRMMGGNDVPGSGWALGVERILLMLKNLEVSLMRPIAIIPVIEQHETNGSSILQCCAKLAQQIRNKGTSVHFVNPVSNSKMLSLKNQLAQASNHNCLYAILVGSSEMNSHAMVIKNMDSRKQETIPFDSFESFLTTKLLTSEFA